MKVPYRCYLILEGNLFSLGGASAVRHHNTMHYAFHDDESSALTSKEDFGISQSFASSCLAIIVPAVAKPSEVDFVQSSASSYAAPPPFLL